MGVVDELRRRVEDELERCAVGRDHPFHRALVAGDLGRPELVELARQQWLFHVRFPAVLAALAAGCGDPQLRAPILTDAYEQDTGAVSGTGSRLQLWRAVASTWGVADQDLDEARALPTTDAMLAIQDWVARRPFVEAYVGIQIGVYAESAPHMPARRRAMEDAYRVVAPGLDYFAARAVADPVGESLEPIEPMVTSASIAPAAAALRLVLHARWSYFDGIAAASGWRERAASQ